MTRRLFVAVWLPEETRRAAAEVLRRLEERGDRVRWVAPENLHVTLAFLGDVDDARTPDLTRRLAGALRGAGPFDVTLGRPGTFPARGPARVVWLGIEEGAKEIAALASRVERALLPGGYVAPSDRPFAAHVTLGRPKGARGFGRPEDLPAAPAARGAGRIEEVTLAESRLTPRGAQYEARAVFPLTGGTAEPSGPDGGESE